MYSIMQTAKRAGVSETTVREHLSDGRLKSCGKIGLKKMIDDDEFKRWLKTEVVRLKGKARSSLMFDSRDDL